MADCKRCFLGENDACYPHVAEDKECDIFRPITNADRIRSMTDEELAKWIANDLIEPGYYKAGQCEEIWLEWLKQEAE